jgi:hypothetical protein
MVQGNYEKIFITTFKLHFFNYYKGHIMHNLNQALAQDQETSGDGSTDHDPEEAAKALRQCATGFMSLAMFILTMAVSYCGSLLLSSDIGQKALKDMRLGTFHNKDLVGKTALGAAILFVISTLYFCRRGFPERKPNLRLATAATAAATIASTALGSLKDIFVNNGTTGQFCSDMEAAVAGAAMPVVLTAVVATGSAIRKYAVTTSCCTKKNTENSPLLSNNDQEDPDSKNEFSP